MYDDSLFNVTELYEEVVQRLVCGVIRESSDEEFGECVVLLQQYGSVGSHFPALLLGSFGV